MILNILTQIILHRLCWCVSSVIRPWSLLSIFPIKFGVWDGPMCPSVSQYCNIAAEAHSDSAQSVGDCGSVEISPAVRTLHADLTCNTQPPHGWPAQDSLPPLVSTLQADHHHHSYMLDLGARVPHLVNYLELLRPEYVVVGTQMII